MGGTTADADPGREHQQVMFMMSSENTRSDCGQNTDRRVMLTMSVKIARPHCGQTQLMLMMLPRSVEGRTADADDVRLRCQHRQVMLMMSVEVGRVRPAAGAAASTTLPRAASQAASVNVISPLRGRFHRGTLK